MKITTIIKNLSFLLWMLRKRIKSRTVERWVKEYIDIKVETLNIKSTERQFFLGFIARYGVGKTTVAQKIAEQLPFIHLSSDEGRRLLQQQGVSSEVVGKEKLIFFAGFKVIQELMRQRINILLDADLRQSHFRKSLQEVVESEGYNFLLVHVIARDEVVRERMKQRQDNEESAYLRENMERHFMDRKIIHEVEPMPSVFFTFTNEGKPEDLDEQVDKFVSKFKETFNVT